MSEKENDLRPSQRREALMKAFYVSSIRSGEPFFRQWDRVPEKLRLELRQLKSDDIKNTLILFRP